MAPSSTHSILPHTQHQQHRNQTTWSLEQKEKKIYWKKCYVRSFSAGTGTGTVVLRLFLYENNIFETNMLLISYVVGALCAPKSNAWWFKSIEEQNVSISFNQKKKKNRKKQEKKPRKSSECSKWERHGWKYEQKLQIFSSSIRE